MQKPNTSQGKAKAKSAASSRVSSVDAPTASSAARAAGKSGRRRTTDTEAAVPAAKSPIVLPPQEQWPKATFSPVIDEQERAGVSRDEEPSSGESGVVVSSVASANDLTVSEEVEETVENLDVGETIRLDTKHEYTTFFQKCIVKFQKQFNQ